MREDTGEARYLGLFFIWAEGPTIHPAQGNALGNGGDILDRRPNGPIARRWIGPLGRQGRFDGANFTRALPWAGRTVPLQGKQSAVNKSRRARNWHMTAGAGRGHAGFRARNSLRDCPTGRGLHDEDAVGVRTDAIRIHSAAEPNIHSSGKLSLPSRVRLPCLRSPSCRILDAP